MKPGTTSILAFGIGAAMAALTASPAFAWWQFVERPPGFERRVSQRFQTENECKAVLKTTKESLKKAYPKRFPLVGSCEEYR